ncbi:MAG: GDSL-type esterase/lipase family protein [Veillonellales bacterium]
MLLKKRFIFPLILLTLILYIITGWNTLTAKAHKNEENLYLWANDLSRRPEDPPYLTLYYRFRKACFMIDSHPNHPVVFLGDSITDEGKWSKLFPSSPVENRGIGGDTTLGVLNRLNQIIASNPKEIFLMIGTNDLCFGRPIPEIISNYSLILTRFQTELPNTKIYIQSVLPFNDTLFPSRSLRTNNNINELNRQIKGLAKEYDYPYIDLAPVFTTPDGQLPARYTKDGLHLNNAGYEIWRKQIQCLVYAPQ